MENCCYGKEELLARVKQSHVLPVLNRFNEAEGSQKQTNKEARLQGCICAAGELMHLCGPGKEGWYSLCLIKCPMPLLNYRDQQQHLCVCVNVLPGQSYLCK